MQGSTLGGVSTYRPGGPEFESGVDEQLGLASGLVQRALPRGGLDHPDRSGSHRHKARGERCAGPQIWCTTRFGIIWKWRGLPVTTVYPKCSPVTPINGSWKGILTPLLCCWASILPARNAIGCVRG
jgi:hypothetical protein